MSDVYPAQFMPIFKSLRISPEQFLGKGGEGYVYALGETQVVKIYPHSSIEYLEKLQALQQKLAQANLPFQTPLIESVDKIDGICYSIEKKLTGQNLETVFPSLSHASQKIALRNYLDALKPFRNLLMIDESYGQILDGENSIQSESWKDYLTKKLNQKFCSQKESSLKMY